MNLILNRHTFGGDVTWGMLDLNGLLLCTMEPGKDDSEGDCVPKGIYNLVPHSGKRWRDTFALVNEKLKVSRTAKPGFRSAIVIHLANWSDELQGCIAFGMSTVRMRNPRTGKNEKALNKSKLATALVVDYIRKYNIRALEIREKGDEDLANTRI